MTVFSPSLPPYNVTTTSTPALSGNGSRSPSASRSDQLTWVAPNASAPAAVTPDPTRKRRRVSVFMALLSADDVLGGAGGDRGQLVGRVRDAAQGVARAVAPTVHPQDGADRGHPVIPRDPREIGGTREPPGG